MYICMEIRVKSKGNFTCILTLQENTRLQNNSQCKFPANICTIRKIRIFSHQIFPLGIQLRSPQTCCATQMTGTLASNRTWKSGKRMRYSLCIPLTTVRTMSSGERPDPPTRIDNHTLIMQDCSSGWTVVANAPSRTKLSLLHIMLFGLGICRPMHPYWSQAMHDRGLCLQRYSTLLPRLHTCKGWKRIDGQAYFEIRIKRSLGPCIPKLYLTLGSRTFPLWVTQNTHTSDFHWLLSRLFTMENHFECIFADTRSFTLTANVALNVLDRRLCVIRIESFRQRFLRYQSKTCQIKFSWTNLDLC